MPDRNDKRQASRLASGSFDDPEAYVGTVGYRSANVVVHRAPDFAGWLARLDLDGVRLYRSDHNASMSVMSATAEPAFAFSTDRRSRARIAGRDFGFGTIYCIGPDRPFHCSAEGHLAWGSVGFDPDRLAADLEVLRGRPSPGIGHGAMFDASATPGWARLLTASETAVRIGMTAPAALATGSAAANLADTLTGALMDCLETGGLDPDRASIRRHHQILERMLAAIEADHATELTLTRLCRAVRVNARTLNDVSVNYLGVPPIHYLRFHRLTRVYRILRDADPDKTRVSGVFARNGLWDSGRAEGAYRAVFGQTPRETLMLKDRPDAARDTTHALARFGALAGGV